MFARTRSVPKTEENKGETFLLTRKGQDPNLKKMNKKYINK
jgi:hypothetical protein